MEKYKQLQKFIIGFLIFYFVAGLSTEVFLDGREKDFLPFFSWFLFSYTPPEHSSTQYTVRILEYDGKTFDPPVFLNEAYGIVDQPNSPKLRELLRKLGASTLMGSKRESQQLRMLLEQIYLPSSIRYEVVLVTYNPLRRFETGKVESVKKLGEFYKEP